MDQHQLAAMIAERLVAALEQRGRIARIPGKARSIVLLDRPRDAAAMDAAARELIDAAAAVKRAFGAPGDHGYGTAQGDALFALQSALDARAHS